MSILDNLRSCVTRKYYVKRTPTRVYFRVKINDAFKSDNVPSQLKNLLVYIAREGVAVTDLFRRPGNPQDMKKIISDLQNGIKIDWKCYNFYTLANISKRFLLNIEGGLLGPEAEEKMVKSLESSDDQTRIETMHSVIVSQPKKVQSLMALLFGIWFRMIYHTEVNAMSVEAVAKSVAGSVFPSTCSSPQKVEKASKVMEYLITGFASADLFGKDLIEYFTQETKTSISRVEKFKYEFLFPIDVPREKSTRLFMRMLVSEAKKHGFDVIKNVVTKEVFEASNWNYTLIHDEDYDDSELENHSPTYQNEENSLSNQSKENVPPKNEPIVFGQTPNEITPTVRSSHFQQEEISSPESSFIQTMTTTTSATLTPKLVRHASFTKKQSDQPLFQLNRSSSIKKPMEFSNNNWQGGNNTRKKSNKISRNVSSSSRKNPVQQFCEKRTCVTASSKLDDSVERKSTTDIINYDRPIMTSSQTNPDIGCFNSVKRRQLERLQKRSDWFLSPPIGIRSSVLMQIDPSCNRAVFSNTLLPNYSESMLNDQRSRSTIYHSYANDCNGDDFSKLNSSPSMHDNPSTLYDSNRHVEVRYFVVERYYGPGPGSSSIGDVHFNFNDDRGSPS